MEKDKQPASKVSSPLLHSFEVNPFRILRLDADISTNDASIQAERIITLARANIPPEEPDLLPWAPAADIYEIQSAAQTIEEPFLRLTDQLLWFDTVRDIAGTDIRTVLRDIRGKDLSRYVSEAAKLPEVDEADAAGPEEDRISILANAVNQASLRLLLAASRLNGILVHQIDGDVEIKEIGEKDWKAVGELHVLPDAHLSVVGTADEDNITISIEHQWSEGLRRWNEILVHPWFEIYVVRCIEDLGDDFVSAGDVETIQESIRTRLADLATRETRFLLLEGRYFLARTIISALSRCGFEKRVLGPALRPIYHLFESEISELTTLLESSGEADQGNIGEYLKRLDVLGKRWEAMDESGIVGLSQLRDEAVERSFLQLRAAGAAADNREALLVKMVELASARSLQERISSFGKELEEARNRLCYFCGETPDYEKSVVLNGKKETGRQTYGNTTTVYYERRYAIILRCDRCARLHDFVRTGGSAIGTLIILVTISGVLLFGRNLLLLLIEAALSCRFVGILLLIGSFWAFVFLCGVIVAATRSMIARSVSPAEHKRYGDYMASDSYKALAREFVTKFTIEPDWRSNAITFVDTK
jgi:hypothetical protein